VWQRYNEAVQLLLVRGCDVNSTDDCGYSPLHLAAEHDYIDMMKVTSNKQLYPRNLLPFSALGAIPSLA